MPSVRGLPARAMDVFPTSAATVYSPVPHDDFDLEEPTLSNSVKEAVRTLSRRPSLSLSHWSLPPNVDYIALQHDCYAISVVKGVSPTVRLAIPLAAAILQCFILYTIGFTNENLFDGGHWLEPISEHMWLNIVRMVSVSVAFFKICNELQDAQRLCWVLTVGDFGSDSTRKFAGWIALSLQYITALNTLFVALSTILAGESCYMCIIKIFAVFIVVDIDNLVGEFLEAIWRLEFDIPTSRELTIAAVQRERLVGNMLMRSCFLIVPTVLLLAEFFISVWTSTLPVTILQHGYVSNDGAPILPTALDGCCPPMTNDSVLTGKTTFEYTALVLAPKHEPPPLVFWVALPARPEPKMPSSLQVAEGKDGNANSAFRSGTARALPVQAHYWLQTQGFPQAVYGMLRQQEQLYYRSMPYAVSFTVEGLRPFGFAYRIYVAAQNPRTRALSENPVVSAKVVTSVCSLHCDNCDLLGPGRCDHCAKGTRRTPEGFCIPCTPNCLHCEGDGKYGDGKYDRDDIRTRFALMEQPSDGTFRCDLGGCAGGYGDDGEGKCKSCDVESCQTCDHAKGTVTPGLCDICQDGFGSTENGTCSGCSHERCQCGKAGECDACTVGWGLVSNGTCVECPEGCVDCLIANSGSCIGCKSGFVNVGSSSCQRCALHCANCDERGPGHCDKCRDGFGLIPESNSCHECKLAHCLQCSNPHHPLCIVCERGFGVSPEGLCETCGNFCDLCDWAGKCSECVPGYAAHHGECWSCADGCVNCLDAGPAQCDQCMPGFTIENVSRTCLPAGDSWTEM